MTTITFACKKISREEIIKCSFDLNKTSYNLLIFLLKQKTPLKIREISKKMKLERSSVQKSIKSLLNQDLITRSQKNLKNGGYTYFYETKHKPEIKQKIKKILKEWHEKAEKEISRL